jgi:hypothetical protein
MPPQILQQVAADLSPRSRIAFGRADLNMYSNIRPEVDAASISMDATRVNTLVGFHDLLHAIQRRLPESFRREPLAALGARIPRLPENQQQQAIDAFLIDAIEAQTFPGPRPLLLDELMRAALRGPLGLAIRETNAVGEYGPATTAVRNGENVLTVADRYGITNEAGIDALEATAVNGPGVAAALRDGATVQNVARRFGVFDSERISELTWVAAKEAVRRGSPALEVIGAFNITDQEEIDELVWRADSRLRRSAI